MLNFLGHGTGYGDTTGIGQRLEPCGDIDALAVAVITLQQHVSEVHTDPDAYALPLGNSGIALDHAALKRDGAFYGIYNAAKLGQEPIAHELEDAALMLFDLGLEQFLAVQPKPLK